jgi:hypothetical protein
MTDSIITAFGIPDQQFTHLNPFLNLALIGQVYIGDIVAKPNKALICRIPSSPGLFQLDLFRLADQPLTFGHRRRQSTYTA